MKNRQGTRSITSGRLVWCLALLVVLSCGKASLAAQEGAKQVPPTTFIFYSGLKSPLSDIVNARLKEAFRRLGLEARVVSLPSQRALFLANADGAGDGARVLNVKELAPDATGNLVLVPEISVTAELAVFTKDLEFPVTGWDSLKPYRNGARLGAKILEKNIPGERVFLVKNSQLFKMLDAGRLDTVVEWRLPGLNLVRGLNLTGIKDLAAPVAVKNFYPYVHKKHRHLVPKLAKVLKEMKQDGTYQRLAEQYMAEPNKEATRKSGR